MKKIITLTIALVLLQHAYAQPGSLDSSFGIGGKVLTAIGTSSDEIQAMDVQKDGKIVVAGSSKNGNNFNYVLARYNYNGSLDQTFDGDGIVLSGDLISRVKIQSDGKIVVAGYNALGFTITRYNTNGNLDNNFGNNGKSITSIGSNSWATALAFQEDGKIVLAGSSMGNFALVRYNTDGTPDLTFDHDGVVTTPLAANTGGGSGANALAIQKDGKIIAAGSGNDINYYAPLGDFTMARYNANGTLDTSFNRTGKVFTHFSGQESATAMGLQADGKIILGGNRYYGHRNECVVARYTTDGRLDTTFNGGAAFPQFGSTMDYTTGVAVQADGKVLLSGVTFHRDNIGLGDYDFAMARYTANGLSDVTFGQGGTVITGISTPRGPDYPLAIQLFSNRIYLAGYANDNSNIRRFSIVAYKNDGLELPLKLLNFSASVNNLSVLCDWQTEQEFNTSHFNVQRSQDGIRFENIGKITAQGNMYNVYQFTEDLSTVSSQLSTIYYRLEMTDKDGVTTYSSVAIIKMIQHSSFTISPNPAKTFVKIKGNGLQQVAMFDVHGKLVLIKNISANDNNILNIAHLPKGAYVLKLKFNQDPVQTEKLIIN